MLSLQLTGAWIVMSVIAVPVACNSALKMWGVTDRPRTLVGLVAFAVSIAGYLHVSTLLDAEYCQIKRGHPCSAAELEDQQADQDAAYEAAR